MDTTGLIFVAVVVAWLVYLVPQHLARRAPEQPEAKATPPMPGELTVTLHKGTPPAPVAETEPVTTLDLLEDLSQLPVSTDLTRRAQRHALSRMARRAATIRRRTLTAGLVIALVAVGLWLAGLTGWLTPVLGVVGLLSGLVLARWNTVRSTRRLDHLRQSIDQASDETTVAIIVEVPLSDDYQEQTEIVDLTTPIAADQQLSLWDPLPVPAATYVSQPMAPRTIRTIDLASPQPAQPVAVVTAEGDQLEDEDDAMRQAV
ncbi:MAG: hypothetical protein LBL92_04865 [Propionibacteriaceae bacterium]|jgi:hypothetical protein|nr:hypothetical protein [Propionibacteriaceae bacterium]